MGRKIPARKHRTVKDPYVQRAQKFAKVKNKINNPPGKADEQEIPKSVLQIMKLKERAKRAPKKRIRKKKNKNIFDMKRAIGKEVMMPGMEVPEKPIPLIEQMPLQGKKDFLRKVDSMVHEVLKQSKYEDKYNVDVERDETGAITGVTPRKQVKRSKKPKLSVKRKEKEQKKKEGKETPKDFAKKELIEFGDIVHQPPTNLTTPKNRAAKKEAFPKPGKRNLVLKKIISETESKHVVSSISKKKKQPMSSLEKQKVEMRRKLVVEAFRQSKKSGHKL